MRTAFIILGLGLLLSPFLFQKPDPAPGPEPEPDPVPVPTPDDLSDLAKEIKVALEGQPEDTAARYAGWFRAIGDTLANGDQPVKDLRTAWVKADAIIDLPQSLEEIGNREIKPFEGPNPDRKEYAAAWYKLADACEELTAGGD